MTNELVTKRGTIIGEWESISKKDIILESSCHVIMQVQIPLAGPDMFEIPATIILSSKALAVKIHGDIAHMKGFYAPIKNLVSIKLEYVVKAGDQECIKLVWKDLDDKLHYLHILLLRFKGWIYYLIPFTTPYETSPTLTNQWLNQFRTMGIGEG
jgi:hypothetical protein